MKVNRARLTFRQPTVANWVFYPFFEVSMPRNVRSRCAAAHITLDFQGGPGSTKQGDAASFSAQ